MNHPASDSPLISWPCYEPSGHAVQLSESDLVQHVLFIGSTGSGKSTLLIDTIQQLIAENLKSPQEKVGLLILDAKADDLLTRVQEAARRSSRGDDIILFGPEAGHGLNLFGDLRNLDDVDRMTAKIMLATDKFSADNAYWWHSSKAMLSAALTMLIAAEQPIIFESVVEFLRRWFLSPVTPRAVLDLLQYLNERGGKLHPLVATAMDQVPLWQDLDSRTRSNLQSCLLTILRPLMSPAAIQYLGSKGNLSPALAASDGRICIVSVNAMKEPELARFVFRLAKQSFFDAVQLRGAGSSRLCGILADELPLVVTSEDADQLATVRSKRCFVVAATQGLHTLSDRVGQGPMRSLVNNFNTVVYMRSREAESAVQAFVSLGTRKEENLRRRLKDEGGMLGLFSPSDIIPPKRDVPVCPVGALGQLAPHQAFLSHADGRRTETPVWFVPWFERNSETGGLHNQEKPDKTSAAHVEKLMAAEGFRMRWNPHVVLEAAAFARRRRRKTLRRVQAFFEHKCCHVPEGLETLPDCWLSSLPGILWNTRKPHWTKLPYFIRRVSVSEGLLILEFAQEVPEVSDRFTAWDRIRVMVNASIYPNRWRRLSAWHRVKLLRHHPELRQLLKGSAQAIF